MPFLETLGCRLLEAGIAPCHIGRYLAELEDHLADLVAEEGGGPSAHAAALSRLGTMEDLVGAMTSRTCFHSWTARAPWAVFPIAALAGLAGGYLAVTFLLMSAIKAFCPLVDGHPMPPAWLPPVADATFIAVRFLLPPLVGWSVAAFALTRRQATGWPIVAMVASVLVGSGLYCRADWPAEPRSWSFCVGTLLDDGPHLLDGWAGYAVLILLNISIVLGPYLHLRARRLEAFR